MTPETIRARFEELEKMPPKMHIPYTADGHFVTTFWEDLYQVFKARMIEEAKTEKLLEEK